MLSLSVASSASAQCVDPPGEAGSQVFNSTYSVMQYCDGDKWIGMGHSDDALGNLSCTPGQIAQYDGTDWTCVPGTATKVDKAGDTMTGNLAVPAPAAGGHAANKTYVDDAAAGVLPTCNTGEVPVMTAGGWGCVELPSMPPANCSLDGVAVAHGDSRDFYQYEEHANCNANRQNRTCTDGSLDGSGVYQYASCSAPAPDTTPDAFSFNDVTNAPISTVTTPTPASITISGINTPTPVSVSGPMASSPQISINSGGWVTSGTITNGQTLAVRLTSPAVAGNTHTATIDFDGVTADSWSVTSGLGCAGVSVGDYCWYHGAVAKTCNETCTTHGGCNLPGTKDYAGSGGTDANCKAVLDALGASGNAVTPTVNAVGCSTSLTDRNRGTSMTSCGGSFSGVRRACACNQ